MVDYRDQKTFQEIRDSYAPNFISFSDGERAFKFLRTFEDYLKNNPDFVKDALYLEYQIFLTKARFVCLERLPSKEAINLFKDHFKEIFELSDSYDLWKKLKALLVAEVSLKERDEIKRQIREALLANPQVYLSEFIDNDGKKAAGSISNYLHYYNAKLGTEIQSQLAISQFITQDKTIFQLPDEEKKKLLYLLLIYEYLKKSSMTPEGLEENFTIVIDDKKYIFKEGLLEEIKTDNADKILNELEQKGYIHFDDKKMEDDLLSDLTDEEIMQLMEEKNEGVSVSEQESEFLEQAASKTVSVNKFKEEVQEGEAAKPAEIIPVLENEALREKYQTFLKGELYGLAMSRREALKKDAFDHLHLKMPFFHALNTKDAPSVIAVLWLLAENSNIRIFFQDDKRYVDFYQGYLEKNIANQTQISPRMNANDFRKNPAAKVYLGSFLKLMLEKRLGLTKDESAIVAMAMAVRAYEKGTEREYSDLAYGDEESGEFQWGI